MEQPIEAVRRCNNPSCNKPLDSRRPKYCSEDCRIHHSSRRQYEKLRNSEEFKEKRKNKNKKYYEEHKEDLKARMRIYGMQYYFKKRDEKKKLEEAQSKKEETTNESGENSSQTQTINIE